MSQTHVFGSHDSAVGTQRSQADTFPPQAAELPSLSSLSSSLPLDAVTAGSSHPAVWQSDSCRAESSPVCFSLKVCSMSSLFALQTAPGCTFTAGFSSSASVELLHSLVFPPEASFSKYLLRLTFVLPDFFPPCIFSLPVRRQTTVVAPSAFLVFSFPGRET